jgi:hypothetical protein
VKSTYIISGLGPGEAEGALFRLLQRLDPTRFDLSVVSLTTMGISGSRIEALGIPGCALGKKRGSFNMLRFIKLVRRLGVCRLGIIHAWLYQADLIGGIASKLSGCGVVVRSLRHGNLSIRQNKLSTLAVMRLCALLSPWLPKRILSCSVKASLAHRKVGHFASKIRQIPNGFDLARFLPDDSSCKPARAELGLNGKLLLSGLRDDIPRLMSALDVLVSTSFGEAFPNVLAEAMPCAVPYKITDAGDSTVSVGETGLVAESGDRVAVARHVQKLLEILAAKRRGLGQRARRRIAEKYEINKIVCQYGAFYEYLALEARLKPELAMELYGVIWCG